MFGQGKSYYVLYGYVQWMVVTVKETEKILTVTKMATFADVASTRIQFLRQSQIHQQC